MKVNPLLVGIGNVFNRVSEKTLVQKVGSAKRSLPYGSLINCSIYYFIVIIVFSLHQIGIRARERSCPSIIGLVKLVLETLSEPL